ncbi:hypothetical protein FRC12_004791 [Ceratobasidium sp. 428]|nr:hypothetical protein FRC12_004791 [Ceratobasidium sp. 428]
MDNRTRARDVAEKALVLLNTELESLATEENALRAARFSLLTLRNKSETLAPINMLPPEILLQVFALCVPTCCRTGKPVALSYKFVDTCAYWRQLALDTSYFWTHIDVGPNVPQKLNKLMLERAKTHPLHLHVTDVATSIMPYDPDPLFETLKPIIHRVHTLQIYGYDGTFFARAIKLWLEHGDKHLAKFLWIFQFTPLSNDFQGDLPLINTSEHGEEVLLSLRTLDLFDVRFNWSSNAYRGLVDLRLMFIHSGALGTISSLELVHILMASPMLAVLKLEGLQVTGPLQTIPVPLNHLRTLNLTCMPVEGLRRLLSLMALPRSSSAELSVGIAFYSELEDELKNFLGQSSITSLYCFCKSINFSAWSSILMPLDTLHTLVLDMHTLELQDDALPPWDNINPQLAVSSRPLKLVIKDCCPPFEDMNSLISNLGVHELCIGASDRHNRYDIDPPNKEYWENIRISLIQAHPNLQYAIREEFIARTELSRPLDVMVMKINLKSRSMSLMDSDLEECDKGE